MSKEVMGNISMEITEKGRKRASYLTRLCEWMAQRELRGWKRNKRCLRGIGGCGYTFERVTAYRKGEAPPSLVTSRFLDIAHSRDF